MDAVERNEILSRYADHAKRFDAAASRRVGQSAEIIPFNAPLRELEQEPTPREVQVLQLIAEGLVNREIGKVLFLSRRPSSRTCGTCSPSFRPAPERTLLRSASAAASSTRPRRPKAHTNTLREYGAGVGLRPSTRGFPHRVEIPQQGNATRLWKNSGYDRLTGPSIRRAAEAESALRAYA